MLSTLFIKKIFYFFTTGTLLFYIVSFETAGQASTADEIARKELILCQENVRAMNSGYPFTLKNKFQITYKNVIRLNPAEQKAVTAYLKEIRSSLVKDGESSPLKVSAYKFEGKSNQVLGYKVVVQTWSETTDQITYFLDKNAQILFKHVDGFVPVKSWTCEKEVL